MEVFSQHSLLSFLLKPSVNFQRLGWGFVRPKGPKHAQMFLCRTKRSEDLLSLDIYVNAVERSVQN